MGGRDEGLDLVQIALIARSEVVEPNDTLVELEQGFQEVGADKTGNTGDEPGPRVVAEGGLDLGVAWHLGVGGRGVVVADGVAGGLMKAGWLTLAAPSPPAPPPRGGEGSEEGAAAVGAGVGVLSGCR